MGHARSKSLCAVLGDHASVGLLHTKRVKDRDHLITMAATAQRSDQINQSPRAVDRHCGCLRPAAINHGTQGPLL